jgi:hypothetical protein
MAPARALDPGQAHPFHVAAGRDQRGHFTIGEEPILGDRRERAAAQRRRARMRTHSQSFRHRSQSGPQPRDLSPSADLPDALLCLSVTLEQPSYLRPVVFWPRPVYPGDRIPGASPRSTTCPATGRGYGHDDLDAMAIAGVCLELSQPHLVPYMRATRQPSGAAAVGATAGGGMPRDSVDGNIVLPIQASRS